MNLKCLFGFHKWEKYGGPRNMLVEENSSRNMSARDVKR